MLSVLTFVALLSAAPSTVKASESVFNHFATCSADIDTVAVTLDFFEEFNSDSGASLGKGYLIQTMGPLVGENSKMMGKIDVVDNADKTAKKVTMFALLYPDKVFASFEVKLKEKSSVEIYAPAFGAVWAKVNCVPTDVMIEESYKGGASKKQSHPRRALRFLPGL